MSHRPVDDPQQLTGKERVFVSAYTNPESPGFLNATQSVMIASPQSKITSARARGYDITHRPAVKNAIERALDANGFGIDERLNVLARIGNGAISVEKEVVTKSGNVLSINVRPSLKERLNAIELANKMEGMYEQQKLDSDLARDEAAELRRRILKEVS